MNPKKRPFSLHLQVQMGRKPNTAQVPNCHCNHKCFLCNFLPTKWFFFSVTTKSDPAEELHGRAGE